jgi:peptidoglycan/xylan/chitin deacetylase (PgdA/CDA1 family)
VTQKLAKNHVGIRALLDARGSLWLRPRATQMALVLGYHNVVADPRAIGASTLPGMMVSLATLRAQLEWVGRHYRFVSLDELGALIERRQPCHDVATVTFDDGYRAVYELAAPLLQKMGVPAAIFVVTDTIGTDTPPLHDQIYQILAEVCPNRRPMPAELAAIVPHYAQVTDARELTREVLARVPASTLRDLLQKLRDRGAWPDVPAEIRPLDWEALAAMQRAGFTVGSHTRTHALLTREDDETVRDELVRSRGQIEQRLGGPVRHFAYPDGRFNRRILRAVAAAGYSYAYTICQHRDATAPQLTIPRVMLWEGSCRNAFGRFSSTLLQAHAYRILPFSRCRRDHGIGAAGAGASSPSGASGASGASGPSTARSAASHTRSAPNP